MGIKLPKRAISKAAKQRARRIGRKRLGKRFAKNLLNQFSFNDYGDKREEKQLRDWRRSLYAGALKRQLQTNVVDEPPMDSPTQEGNLSNPDISALNEQLKKVLKTAKTMGLVDKETQNLALKQIRDANRAAKENQLEAPQPNAVPEPQEGTGNEISPLANKMEDLIKAFEDLIDTVEDKNNEDKKSFLDNLADRFGLGEAREKYKKKPARLKEGFKAERTKGGKIRYRGPDGRLTTPEKALQRGYAKKQIVKEAQAARAARAAKTGEEATSIFGKITGAAKNIFSPVTGKTASAGTQAIAKTGVLSRGTSKIAGGIKAGAKLTRGAAVKGAELTGQVLKNTIIKVAGPKVAKALATTGVKSIPILGAVAGLGFAASRLVDGDWLGAGLDAVSGLAGPVTAIPAMVASLSRDIYNEVFGIQPESDPQFGERMGVVKDTVKGLVESQIGKKVQPKGAAGQQGKTVAPPQAVKQTSSQPTVQQPPEPPKAQAPASATTPIDASKDAQTTSGKSLPAAPPPQGGPTTKPESGGGGGGPSGASSTPASDISKPGTATAAAQVLEPKTAVTLPPATTTGAQITAASEAAEMQGKPQPKIGVSVTPIRPSKTPTTKTGAKGMGNVPDPTYMNVGMITKQLYFSASV